MFKLSWGYIAAIFFLSFAIFISIMAYMAIHEKFELISPNYYADELKYQQKINAMENANQLGDPTKVNINGKQIELDLPKQFDGKKVEGSIQLIRPSDETKDLKFVLQPNFEGIQIINSDKLVRGLYLISIDWKSEGKEYFVEQKLFLQ